jgi:predicted 2-oxoglutarate/Fe(II)-dependent dioxygenase YbiX
MTVERPEFTAPLLIIDDFLSAEHAALCLQEAIDLRPVYMPASVGQADDNRIDRKIRRNDVVYLDSVFSSAPERSKILTLVKRRIDEPDCNRLWHQGYFLFDVINYGNWRESVLSRYGQCDFYGLHQDTKHNKTNPGELRNRLVTLVYYMNTEPERFTGGALTLQQDDGKITVTPKHNRAVVFPSFVYHKVENVQLNDEDFSAGRFSLNLWIGFR